MSYTKPSALKDAFTCPNCTVFSHHQWWGHYFPGGGAHEVHPSAAYFGKCARCGEYSVFIGDRLVHPMIGIAPPPNAAMPDGVKMIYSEAASVLTNSPRASAALLRLAVQVLCKHLGEEGANINTDIKHLVAKGLPEVVQQSLDVLRVTGNEAVHPGQIDTDSPEVVIRLFELLNVIVEYMIALPNRVGKLFQELPAGALEGIAQRDRKPA